MDYAIRLTFEYDSIKDVIERIASSVESIVVYQHDKDDTVSRTHIHMLVVGCKHSTDTLKNWIKKHIGAVEKTDWSFKAAKKEESERLRYIAYMSKGRLDPLLVRGFTEEFIEKCKSSWVDPKEVRVNLKNGKLVKEIDEAANVSKRQLVEEMVAVIGSDYPSTRAILIGIRKVLIQHRCVVGMYKVMDYYDAYMMYAHKELWLDMLAERIEKRNMR